MSEASEERVAACEANEEIAKRLGIQRTREGAWLLHGTAYRTLRMALRRAKDDERAVAAAERRAAHGARWCVPATVRAVLPLVRALYASPEGGAGCCLHIVLDDCNVEDSHVAFCEAYARKQGHDACERLAVLLRAMTRGQRWKVAQEAGDLHDPRWRTRTWS